MKSGWRLASAVGLAMLAFAGNSLLNRAALAQTPISPALFAAVRLASGAVALSALTALRGGPVPLRSAGRMGDAAALALYVLGFSFAYRWLGAGIGALVLFGTVQIAMFAGAVLSGEGMPRRRLIGAGLAFGGLVWLLWPTGPAPLAPEGAALMAAAGLGWGLYSLRGRRVQDEVARDPTARTAANFVLATPIALVPLVLLGPGTPDRTGLLLAVISGAVTSGMGYALWYAVLPRLKASSAAVAQLTVPVIAVAGGLILLGEAPSLRLILASALVIGGVGWSLRAPRAG